MIPADLAARLRVLAETAVQPLSAVRELPSDPPPLSRGQHFQARIESALPDGTFKAIVAGKSVTLSLSQAVTVGDTLELVVVSRAPRLIVASLSNAQSAIPAAGAPNTTLSHAAQLIGALLSESGEVSRQAVPLAQDEPILNSPPQNGRGLAPLLRNAVSESGMFYESHQAQWIAGRWPLASLLREPQGRQSASLRPAGEAAAGSSTPVVEPPDSTSTHPASSSGPSALAAGFLDELAPLVRQQLDTLSNHHVTWQGQIWPGQTMEWDIGDARREHPASADQPETWTTTLRLDLPRLGSIAATLSLNAAREVSVNLRTTDRPSVALLESGADELGRALGASGVPLLGMRVEYGESA